MANDIEDMATKIERMLDIDPTSLSPDEQEKRTRAIEILQGAYGEKQRLESRTETNTQLREINKSLALIVEQLHSLVIATRASSRR